MDLKELLETNPEDLAIKQRDALIRHVLNRLTAVYDAVASGEFHVLEDMLFDSPAGDEMGCDNSCINFDFTNTKGSVTDIRMVIDRIRSLNELCPPDRRIGAKKGKAK